MFGYVRPLVSELRVREAEAYRAFYCGVCRRLGRQCGPACRLFLQYDFAFFALVMDTVFEAESPIGKALCAVNPLKRVHAADGAAVRYAADAHGILLLGKAMDDRADGSPLRRVPVSLLHGMTKKAIKRQTKLYDQMLVMLADQAKAERDSGGVDEASRPFAAFCAEMFSPCDVQDTHREALRWLGFHLGKWIYMADALDDFTRDMNKAAFNPWNDCASRSAAAQRALPLMNLCAEQALAAWDVLPERRWHAIVRNILEMGLYHTADSIASDKRTDKQPIRI